MAALVEQVAAGAGAHRWPLPAPAGEHPWSEDATDLAVDGDVEEAVPLALALIPAKGVE